MTQGGLALAPHLDPGQGVAGHGAVLQGARAPSLDEDPRALPVPHVTATQHRGRRCAPDGDAGQGVRRDLAVLQQQVPWGTSTAKRVRPSGPVRPRRTSPRTRA